jgi:hypothetical protein
MWPWRSGTPRPARFSIAPTRPVSCSVRSGAPFSPDQLQENLGALVDALNKSKPATVKGIYLRKLSVSSTMGPGVRVDVASLGGAQPQQ